MNVPVIMSPVTKNTTDRSNSHLLAASSDDNTSSFLFFIALVLQPQ